MTWRLLQGGLFALAITLFFTGQNTELTNKIFGSGGGGADAEDLFSRNALLIALCAMVFFGMFYWKFGQWQPNELKPERFPVHPPRAFTTPAQYHSWALFYGLIHVLIFLIVLYLPEILSLLITIIDNYLPESFQTILEMNSSNQLSPEGQGGWYNLALSVAIFAFYIKSELEARMRAIFHRRAMIPREAENMFHRLRRDFFKQPGGEAADIRAFLDRSAQDPEMPEYFEFELVVDTQQHLQRRMELLPRAEFILWRLRQRGFGQNIDQILDDHETEFQKIVSDVQPLRDIALKVNEQLMEILNVFRDLDVALCTDKRARELGFKKLFDDLDDIMIVPRNGETISKIPVSRLDDVAFRLKQEISELSPRLAAINEIRFGASTHREKRTVSLEEVVTALSNQIHTVIRGLAPLCECGLNAVDDSLSEQSAKVGSITDRTLAFSICAALSASVQTDRKFFSALSLPVEEPPIQLHQEAAFLIVTPVAMYLIFLTLAPEIPAIKPIFDFATWLAFGCWMIIAPIMMGYYHGGALASLRSEEKTSPFSLLDSIWGFRRCLVCYFDRCLCN